MSRAIVLACSVSNLRALDVISFARSVNPAPWNINAVRTVFSAPTKAVQKEQAGLKKDREEKKMKRVA
jgi:hypothetical protein